MPEKIELSQEELEDIKDDIKWRTSMTIYMKQLKDIPAKVASLENHRSMHYFLITAILISVLWFKFT